MLFQQIDIRTLSNQGKLVVFGSGCTIDHSSSKGAIAVCEGDLLSLGAQVKCVYQWLNLYMVYDKYLKYLSGSLQKRSRVG